MSPGASRQIEQGPITAAAAGPEDGAAVLEDGIAVDSDGAIGPSDKGTKVDEFMRLRDMNDPLIAAIEEPSPVVVASRTEPTTVKLSRFTEWHVMHTYTVASLATD